MHWQQSLCDQVVTVAGMQGSVSHLVRRREHGSGNVSELRRRNDGRHRHRLSRGSRLLGDVIRPFAEEFGQAEPKKTGKRAVRRQEGERGARGLGIVAGEGRVPKTEGQLLNRGVREGKPPKKKANLGTSHPGR